MNGEMAERLKAHDSKSCVPYGYPGFESQSLRHFHFFVFIKVRRIVMMLMIIMIVMCIRLLER